MQRVDYFALTTAELRTRHRWITARIVGETVLPFFVKKSRGYSALRGDLFVGVRIVGQN